MSPENGNGLTLRQYVDMRIGALEKRFDQLDRALERTEEAGQKVVAEWTRWRNTVDITQTKTSERKAVYAALVVSGLTLLGIIGNAALRMLGH